MPKFPEPQPYAATPRPPIPLEEVESSQLAAVGYDAPSQTLAIRFKHGAGAIYHYPGVSPELYQEFRAAESLGRFFGQRLKALAFDKFPPEPQAQA